MTAPGHEAIAASAGSGKTFALAHRYIRLLGLGVSADRICALTFTRKAAGEIFDSIVQNLVRGATDEKGAAEEARHSDLSGAGCADFTRWLREFLMGQHRLNIGTMDGFIVRVAQTFPLELGLPTRFQLMDNGGFDARKFRSHVLERILSPFRSTAPDRRAFLEAFKDATFGVEERKYGDVLDRLIKDFNAVYRLSPAEKKWGDAGVIWRPGGMPWPREGDSTQAAIQAVRDGLDAHPFGSGARPKNLESSARKIAESLAGYGSTSVYSRVFPESKIFDQLIQSRAEFSAGRGALDYYNKAYLVPTEIARALAFLIGRMIGVEIDRSLRRTHGLWALLAPYNQGYEEESARLGLLTFDDLTARLAGATGAGRLSRISGEDRLYIDYRMDAQLDHWLIDEFQDTSDLQWRVFGPLIDEILQSTEPRSFFYVGDVKQAIYQWREGNPELFRNILAHYNPAGVEPRIREKSLTETYRCRPAIVEAVNRVFSRVAGVLELPETARARWAGVWETHRSKASGDQPGYAAMIAAPAEAAPDAGVEDEAEKSFSANARAAADVLNEIRPTDRNLDVGVLVRTNDQGAEIARALKARCPGLPVVHEGKSLIADNAITQLLLELVRLADHPADTLAWRHLDMSPLQPALAEEKITPRTAARLRREIAEEGYARFLDRWAGRLVEKVDPGSYGRRMIEALLRAAARFDAGGVRNAAAFVEYINEFKEQEPEGKGKVRVMTVHQAKGLGFDVVILPQLRGPACRIDQASNADLQPVGDPSNPEWILKLPRREIARADDALRRASEQADRDACFEGLCLLYVAMTRAKKALYLIDTPPKGDSESVYWATLLRKTLAGAGDSSRGDGESKSGGGAILYESDARQRDWYRSEGIACPAPDRAAADAFARIDLRAWASAGAALRLKRLEPSKQDDSGQPAAALFDAERGRILDFGSALHALLRRVEWADEAFDPESVLREWSASSVRLDPDVRRDVSAQFRDVFRSAGARACFVRPAPDAELWREMPFEMIRDGRMVSGVFDRVVLCKNPRGGFASAEVTDFKSNRFLSRESIEDQVRAKLEQYAPQMNAYRRAVSRLTGLPEESIRTRLLFTKIGRVCDVPAPSA